MHIEVIWLSDSVTFKHLSSSEDTPNLYSYIKCLILAAVHIPYCFGILVLATSAVSRQKLEVVATSKTYMPWELTFSFLWKAWYFALTLKIAPMLFFFGGGWGRRSIKYKVHVWKWSASSNSVIYAVTKQWINKKYVLVNLWFIP